MSKIIADFKVLPLDAQTKAFPQLTSIFNAGKHARSRIGSRDTCTRFSSGREQVPPAVVKYGDRRRMGGQRAEPTWLKTETAESAVKLEDCGAT
jgi:hypothetical protein